MKRYFLCILLASLCASPINAANNLEVETTGHKTSACSDTFVAHTLDHSTQVDSILVRLYESNGAGLAVNDLDNDGLVDIVLANLDGPSTILWNQGELNFETQRLETVGLMRAVNIVDVDGDSWMDIVFTHQLAAPGYWRNQGSRDFVYQTLPGVSEYAYAMDWGDLDRDGDLDLVTASYDVELEKHLGNSFMFSEGAGVFYYENQGGSFVATRLADRSQALVVFIEDLNDDGLPDILVGNDFAVPDQFWLNDAGGWTALQPFATMTHSTMSFDVGDIDNDGSRELFAADMKPYSDDLAVLDKWQPFLEMMANIPLLPDDPQVMENVLQIQAAAGFDNRAATYAVDASGWSWSAKFGDLNSDGFLDLYVVNGMIAFDIFGYLRNSELVEENQAFRNVGGADFLPAPEWGLGSTSSGRGMSMADMDNDGDLDIVINNLLAPAELYENQLCTGHNLTLDLVDETGSNRFALGSQVTLHTSNGRLQRTVRAASGYVSGDSARVHFGIPSGTTLDSLEIHWNDGQRSRLEALAPDSHLRVTRLVQPD